MYCNTCSLHRDCTCRTIDMPKLWTVTSTIVIALCLASYPPPAFAEVCTLVGEEYDACRSSVRPVYVPSPGRGAGLRISKCQTKVLNLKSYHREASWYCNGNKERTAWGRSANKISVSVDCDGRIHWKLYKCQRCAFVDTTYDNCNGDFITVSGKKIIKGHFGLVKLPTLQKEVYWYCGQSNRERTAWGQSANQLAILYYSNGRTVWMISKCD